MACIVFGPEMHSGLGNRAKVKVEMCKDFLHLVVMVLEAGVHHVLGRVFQGMHKLRSSKVFMDMSFKWLNVYSLSLLSCS